MQFDMTKFVEDVGPFSVKFNGMTARFFAWPTSGKEKDNPGCNVRVWYKGKELVVERFTEEQSNLYRHIMRIVSLG